MKEENSTTIQTEIVRASPKSILEEIQEKPHFIKADLGYVHGYHLPYRYVTDIIFKSFSNEWNCRSPVGIFSQTGSGKSTLIFDNLLPTVKERGKRLCILASRTALIYQYRKRAAELEEPKLLKELTDQGIKNRSHYGDIDIYSYQEVLYSLTENPSGFFDEYEMIVLDECHYFIHDSPFNQLTRELLETIIKAAHNCIRVYLTATPDICAEDIIRLEYQYTPCSRYYPYNQLDGRNYMDYQYQFIIYYSDINYDYLRPCFFTEDQEIIEVIKADRSNDKYLICVDSKSIGQSLAGALGSNIAEFIDAELKNKEKSKEVNAMICNEKFDKKVLIATSFLDVGVNLKDDDLRNIVIYSTNKTHFIQSIGRKRKQNQQKVSLYVHIPSVENISSFLKKAHSQKNELLKNIDWICNSKNMYLTDLPDFFFVKKVNGKDQIRYNSFALSYLECRIQELEHMMTALNDIPNSNEAFSRYFLSWLELEHLYESTHWLGKSPDTVNKELVDLIEHNAHRNLSKNEFQNFSRKFLIQYNSLYPQNAIRKERPPHINKLNTIFQEHKLPYTVSNIGNTTYVIQKG